MGTWCVYEVPTRKGGVERGGSVIQTVGRKREIEEEREDVSVREGPAALSLIDPLGPPPTTTTQGTPDRIAQLKIDKK
jgi:hypothetical protein